MGGGAYEDVGREFVGKGDGVDVGVVAADVVEALAALDVVDDDGGESRARDDVPAVAGEAGGVDGKVGPRGGGAVTEVQVVWVPSVVGVGGGEAYDAREAGVGEPLVVGAQVGVREGPLTKGVADRLVMLPVVWVGRVVHAHFVVLRLVSTDRVPKGTGKDR